MSHTWLYRRSKRGTCSVCQAEGEQLVSNGKGHYVCMDVEGCYARWRALDPAGINTEPTYVSVYPPLPTRRRARKR